VTDDDGPNILPPHAFAAIRDELLGREPVGSRPTLGLGAPDLGTDWAWNWGGRDLAVDGPYEPDWWCLIHNKSGQGPGCPDCATHSTDPTS
jgi:hypothetical protein